jgi:hypothetical protein
MRVSGLYERSDSGLEGGGQWICSDSYSKPTSPRGFRESLWGAIELLRADYTLMKLLRKEFPAPMACFGRSAAFERFLRKWFHVGKKRVRQGIPKLSPVGTAELSPGR